MPMGNMHMLHAVYGAPHNIPGSAPMATPPTGQAPLPSKLSGVHGFDRAHPKLREGMYFPDGIIERWPRTDSALAGAITEMWAKGVSIRKVDDVTAEMGLPGMGGSCASRMCEGFDGDVRGLRGARSAPASGPTCGSTPPISRAGTAAAWAGRRW